MRKGDLEGSFVEEILVPIMLYFVEWLGETHGFVVPDDYGSFGASSLVYRFLFEGDINRVRALQASQHARERMR